MKRNAQPSITDFLAKKNPSTSRGEQQHQEKENG